MKTIAFRTTLAALTVAGSLAGSASAQGEVSASFNAQTGTITIQKLTGGFTPASQASVYCSGACPEVTSDMLNPPNEYFSGNALLVTVPALIGVNGSHNHVLSFWDDLFFPKGTANFTVCPNGADFKVQLDKRNGCAKVSRRSQGAVVAIPLPEPKIKLRQ
jgi:hypothetical protein